MFSIELKSRTAIYEQIVSAVEDGILKGLILSGEQLPSVRALSLELTLNPNTVSRAYLELERRGLIVSLVGKGCFVKEDAQAILKSKRLSDLSVFEEVVKGLRLAGLEKETLIAQIEKIYQEETKNDRN
jgi:GntR family transcriptional regulator